MDLDKIEKLSALMLAQGIAEVRLDPEGNVRRMTMREPRVAQLQRLGPPLPPDGPPPGKDTDGDDLPEDAEEVEREIRARVTADFAATGIDIEPIVAMEMRVREMQS